MNNNILIDKLEIYGDGHEFVLGSRWVTKFKKNNNQKNILFYAAKGPKASGLRLLIV